MKHQSSSKYIELLKRSLIDYHYIDQLDLHSIDAFVPTWKTRLLQVIDRLARTRNFGIYKIKKINPNKRINGYDWPARAKTMVGLNRLTIVEFCIRSILTNKLEGDFVETGVWRGGVIILMAALLEELAVNDRSIWAFDSFQGLPKANTTIYPQDKGNTLHQLKWLSATLEEVKNNFDLYNISTQKVIFKKGWFKDTLPNNEIDKIALLRLDGDMYESTILALKHLYPKLTKGGYLIIDDYNAFDYCRQAVDDYRQEMRISASIIEIDKEAIYWQKK